MAQDLLWLNGDIMPLEEGRVNVQDRGLLFSDGIYEVINFYNGKPFTLREHLERWEKSASGILLDSPGTIEERMQVLMDLAGKSGYRNASVYGQLTRGTAPRNHLFPSNDTPPTEFWFARPTPEFTSGVKEKGVSLATHPDERWEHCEFKTISLLPNCLAKERAKRQGAFEALQYLKNDIVTECSASNAWCVRDGVVFTHPATHRILNGITRMAIIDVAYALGIEVREEAVSLREFLASDEVFISSTTMEVMPVTAIDNKPVGSGRVGSVTTKLMKGLRERIVADCEAAAV